MKTEKNSNRPAHICSRGPYRRKRDHLEDLKRWDVRDYIKPTALSGTKASISNLDCNLFELTFEPKPNRPVTLQMYRAHRLPNTPPKQQNHFWYWICPDCDRQCRYLYSLPNSWAITCRKCWELPYQSQTISQAQRRNIQNQNQMSEFLMRGLYRPRIRLPTPPPNWIPDDLIKKFFDK